MGIEGRRPLIIAGPCSAETERQTVDTYLQLAATGAVDIIRAGVWKPRTHPGAFEGAGERGLTWLAKGRSMTGLPFGVEVANSGHVRAALTHGADMVWIGARTTVSPFSVQEIADALKGSDVKVFIKNPLSPDTELWAGAVQRIAGAGIPPENIGLIHRGYAYTGGVYRNAPMWHLAIEMRRRYPDMVMLCDPSHICGNREYLAEVAQKAADLFYDGLIIESHIDPGNALSDACQQLTPTALSEMLAVIKWRAPDADNPEYQRALAECRREIDDIDSELFGLLSRRMDIADRIGRIKRENDVTILQSERWNEIIEKAVTRARNLNLSADFISMILEAIHLESIARQNRVMNR